MDRKGKLVDELKELNKRLAGDPAELHGEMDKALLRYIDAPEVTEQFHTIVKWCS